MKLILLTPALFVLTACALLSDLDKIEKTKSRVCNYDGAFAEGASDAKAGYNMESERVAKYCDDGNKEEASKGYREGYMAGKSSK